MADTTTFEKVIYTAKAHTTGDERHQRGLRPTIDSGAVDCELHQCNLFFSSVKVSSVVTGSRNRRPARCGNGVPRVAAYRRRRSARRRRDEISLDEILLTFHEEGRYADPIVDWSTPLDDPAVQSELRSVLTSALAELPDHYCAVIILHDAEGLSMADGADCLEITVPTAKARAHRAHLLLRQHLGTFMSGAPSGVEMAS